jgi:hypothetical protein
LLRAAEERGYDVLLTIDQGIPHQQNIKRTTAVLVLCAATNKLDDLLPLVPAIESEWAKLPLGQVIFVRG